MKQIIISLALMAVCISASAQYPHGLPDNSNQPKPTTMHAICPYSYSAETDDGSVKNKEYYDAETGTLVVDDGDKRNITTFVLKDGKLMMNSVYYNDKRKVYAPFVSNSRDAQEIEPTLFYNCFFAYGKK